MFGADRVSNAIGTPCSSSQAAAQLEEEAFLRAEIARLDACSEGLAAIWKLVGESVQLRLRGANIKLDSLAWYFFIHF